MMYDVIIIGAGAAGLFAAYAANLRQKKVLILEANSRPGLKILISGGGRCNFTNLNITPKDFVSDNPHFCKSALMQFTQNDFIRLVEEAGISFYEKTLGQLFCTHSSKEILDLLLKKIGNAELKTSIAIQSVTHQENIFEVKTNQDIFKSKNLIVATGGLSIPKLGASDFGYKIAQQFGHTVTKLSPALDGFVYASSEASFFKGLEGISLLATLKINKREFTENILFTHQGLSGPAALKASLFWEEGQELEIDFLPSVSDFVFWIKDKKEEHPKKSFSSVLSFILPARFCERVVEECLNKDIKMAEVSNEHIKKLEQFLKRWKEVPFSTVGYEKAEVTRGGVDTKDISSQTMESKLVPGLYFVGEVVDVTGLLGGYNFQWAWSSGWVAGNNTEQT